MDELIQDMEDSMAVNFSYHANDPSVGLSQHRNIEQYKMYVGDTGLFITMAFWDNAVTDNIIYQKLLSDKLALCLRKRCSPDATCPWGKALLSHLAYCKW